MPRTRRDFLKISGAGFIATGVAFPAFSQAAKKKTNIIYIMSDELGYYELSCMGSKTMITPHIDRMVKEGVRFTQGLAGSSVCAPTRGVLMTGKHSGHTSVRSNGGGTPLRAEEKTVASYLKEAGYATGGFGKWGCGGRGSTEVPEKHGFDTFIGYYDQVHAHSYYPPYLIHNSEEMMLAGNSGGREGKTYTQYVIFNEAKKILAKNKDKPFFLYLPITPPHGMFDIPDDDPSWQLYKDKNGPEEALRYAAMVNMVDRQVGEIFKMLKTFGIDENTIVFFCGDNGGPNYFKSKEYPNGFHGQNLHPKTGKLFRGGKGNLYEGGLRIPMIVRWPGKIKPGRVSDFLWYFPDVLPTACELAGVKVPEDSDGISIIPELIGEKAAGRKQQEHEYLYWEISGQTAVRMKNWKAIQPRKNKEWELYDLDKDIEEKNDVAAQNPTILAKLQSFAKAAHEPVREGTFHNRELHEKDRRAKWGDRQDPRKVAKGAKMPQEGLIPNKDWKIVRVSSENSGNNKFAKNAIDGNSGTIWHSKFDSGALKHPHEIVIDLGKEYNIKGFRYMARQDGGWNGTIKDCEFYVGSDAKNFSGAAVKATFKKVKSAQDALCDKPARGRYVLVRALSEINGGPWATIAELGVIRN